MTSTRVDDELGLPELAGSVPELGASEPAIAVAGPARARPFLIEGDIGAASGSLDGGLDRVRLGDRTVLRDVVLVGPRAVNTVASPGALRRETVGPNGTGLEVTLVAPTLPLLAIQWRGSGGALRLTVLPGAEAIRYRVDGGRLVAVDPGRPDEVVALVMNTGEWRISDDYEGGLEARIDVPGDTTTTLLVASGAERPVRSALAAAPHLAVHTRRALAPPPQGWVVSTGVRDIDEGTAWAAVRLRRSLLRGTALTPPDAASAPRAFWSGIGALAIGDGDGAHRALARLESLPALLVDADSPWPAAPLATILAARIALTCGDARAARRHGELLLRTDPNRLREDRTAYGLWAYALDSLADSLRHADSADRIAELRSTAARQPAPRASGGAVRLPVVGGGGSAPFLLGVLDGDGGGAVPDSGIARLDGVLSDWSVLLSDLDRGWAAWRARLASGLADGPAGAGTWDDVDDVFGPGTPATGALLATLVHGLLGYRPDAPSGRAHLRPRLPAHLTGFGIDGLVLGDARLRFRYERRPNAHAFIIEPTVARVPPVVVFEPSIPGRVASVRIGGEEADLETSPDGDRTRVRVQLPIDTSRTIEITSA